MSTQILASSAAAPKHGAKAQEVVRRTAVFHPSIWGDRFLICSPEDPIMHVQKEHQIRELKGEVRRQLTAISNEPSQQLNFEKEIEEALQHIYETYQEIYAYECDLHNVSLLFRLLRQEGFDVSCDVFNKFKDDKGKLKESLSEDLKGMLGLYEAAHLSKHGDDHLLEEAMAFTITHLTPNATHG